MFTTEWYTVSGYEVNEGRYDEQTGEILSEPAIWTATELASSNNNRNKEAKIKPTASVPPVGPIKQSKFAGKVICGTRGGNSFLNVKRPQPAGSDYECPAGTTACSSITSIDNTMCYPES